MTKKAAKDVKETPKHDGPVELVVKATSAKGAVVKVPGSDEAVLCPIGRTDLEGVVVVVTP